MYSMDFEEFLWAKGYEEERIADMLRHMENMEPFRDIEMEVYKSLFLDYCVLGGMPEVVREYIVTGTFSGSLAIQTQLRMDYEEDIRKYAEGLDQTKIFSIPESKNQLEREIIGVASNGWRMQESSIHAFV